MRIAVVGTCASGKSTVVAELRRRGLQADAVSQEHSIVRNLWAHSLPELLVMLEADYHSVCRRRGGHWPRWLYDLQRERLRDASDHADLIIDTSSHTVAATVDLIVAFVAAQEAHAEEKRSTAQDLPSACREDHI